MAGKEFAVSLILFYDTETTGLPDFKARSNAEHQPHLVDICGLLYDSGTRKLVDSFEALVRPDGWVIPDEVAAIHGITTERALAEGINEAEALEGFMALHRRAGLRVAHNESFDARIIRIALFRYDTEEATEQWAAASKFCTCNATTDVVRIPPTERMVRAGFGRQFKKPNLAESLKYYTGEELRDAHRARPDTEACARIYWAIQDAENAAGEAA